MKIIKILWILFTLILIINYIFNINYIIILPDIPKYTDVLCWSVITIMLFVSYAIYYSKKQNKKNVINFSMLSICMIVFSTFIFLTVPFNFKEEAINYNIYDKDIRIYKLYYFATPSIEIQDISNKLWAKKLLATPIDTDYQDFKESIEITRLDEFNIKISYVLNDKTLYEWIYNAEINDIKK